MKYVNLLPRPYFISKIVFIFFIKETWPEQRNVSSIVKSEEEPWDRSSTRQAKHSEEELHVQFIKNRIRDLR